MEFKSITNPQPGAFLQNLEKAYTEGVYADTPANRKLGRVGMSYAEWTQKQQGGGSKEKVEKKEEISLEEFISDKIFKYIKDGVESLNDDTPDKKAIKDLADNYSDYLDIEKDKNGNLRVELNKLSMNQTAQGLGLDLGYDASVADGLEEYLSKHFKLNKNFIKPSKEQSSESNKKYNPYGADHPVILALEKEFGRLDYGPLNGGYAHYWKSFKLPNGKTGVVDITTKGNKKRGCDVIELKYNEGQSERDNHEIFNIRNDKDNSNYEEIKEKTKEIIQRNQLSDKNNNPSGGVEKIKSTNLNPFQS